MIDLRVRSTSSIDGAAAAAQPSRIKFLQPDFEIPQ
jgi:hypothetical protein